MQELLEKEIREKYPLAVVTFSPPETIFEKLFVTGEADVVAELHTANKSQAPDAEHLQRWKRKLRGWRIMFRRASLSGIR